MALPDRETERARASVAATRQALTTPRAAAVAGILFALLAITSLTLIRLSLPEDPAQAAVDIVQRRRTIALALNLVPFAGIAFLWFMGVVRDRIGDYEDRFFATVFLGSGLLFLAMLFAAAAVAGGLIVSEVTGSSPSPQGESFAFGRTVSYVIMNVYAARMAGVFMLSTATIGLRTGIVPRWMALLGYLAAAVLLLSISYNEWVILLFPAWILLISCYLLLVNLRGPADHPTPTDPA